jgi:hypothetical protein
MKSWVELAQIELMRLTTSWTDGRVKEGHALVFRYGADRRTAYLEGPRARPSGSRDSSLLAECERLPFHFGRRRCLNE